MTDYELDATTNVPCVIIAGGRLKRFGRTRADATLGKKTLAEHMINRLRAQSDGPTVINANSSAPQDHGITVIPDIITEDIGPLAGILTAMKWAHHQGYSSVLTTPIDAPFFPKNLVRSLIPCEPNAVAKCNARIHPIFGVWSVENINKLEDSITSGVRSMHKWIQLIEASIVEFPASFDHAFFNINTPDQLRQAEQMLRLETQL